MNLLNLANVLSAPIEIEHDDYLQQLIRWGTPSIAMRGFIFQTFPSMFQTFSKHYWLYLTNNNPPGNKTS